METIRFEGWSWTPMRLFGVVCQMALVTFAFELYAIVIVFLAITAQGHWWLQVIICGVGLVIGGFALEFYNCNLYVHPALICESCGNPRTRRFPHLATQVGEAGATTVRRTESVQCKKCSPPSYGLVEARYVYPPRMHQAKLRV